jgi:hypothetical protein
MSTLGSRRPLAPFPFFTEDQMHSSSFGLRFSMLAAIAASSCLSLVEALNADDGAAQLLHRANEQLFRTGVYGQRIQQHSLISSSDSAITRNSTFDIQWRWPDTLSFQIRKVSGPGPRVRLSAIHIDDGILHLVNADETAYFSEEYEGLTALNAHHLRWLDPGLRSHRVRVDQGDPLLALRAPLGDGHSARPGTHPGRPHLGATLRCSLEPQEDDVEEDGAGEEDVYVRIAVAPNSLQRVMERLRRASGGALRASVARWSGGAWHEYLGVGWLRRLLILGRCVPWTGVAGPELFPGAMSSPGRRGRPFPSASTLSCCKNIVGVLEVDKI